MPDNVKQQNRTTVSIKDFFRMKNLKEELKVINDSNLMLSKELSTIKLENQTHVITLSEQSKNIAKFTEEIDNCLKETEELNRKNQGLIRELTNIEYENSKLNEEIDELKHQISKLQSESDAYRTYILEKENEVVNLKSSVSTSELKIATLASDLETAKSENWFLELDNQRYKTLFTDDHEKVLNIKEYLVELEKEVCTKGTQVTELESKIKSLNDEIVVLNDEVLYQSFGLYTPLYDFASSEDYKHELDEVRKKQKEMLKENTATLCNTTWTVNNSLAEGRKMTNHNIKQILRSFNTECENAISRVKFNNLKSIEKRITKAFESLNALQETNGIKIQRKYLELKYQELWLAYEYQLKKQDEKDELRMLREQRREEAKLLKEIEEKRREIEKEQQHYDNALKKLNEQIEREKSEIKLQFLLNRKKDIENNLVDLDVALKEIDYREANQRAGYVYIISNIGSFGENIYKIGMTRRLDPQERIDELGSASVPFRFDVHAMIFSDDAPGLETSLHKAFESKKINTINGRKEFFNVTLEEIEKVVKANHDRTVDFIKTPEARQYRETLMQKRKEVG